MHCSSKKIERIAREATDICLRVLRKATKVGSKATVVRNSVLIISHITFRDCRVHIFSDNLSWNNCILSKVVVTYIQSKDKDYSQRIFLDPIYHYFCQNEYLYSINRPLQRIQILFSASILLYVLLLTMLYLVVVFQASFMSSLFKI